MTKESESDKWARMTNPKTLEDYGICVNLAKLMMENPELVQKEILPYLPTGALNDLST